MIFVIGYLEHIIDARIINKARWEGFFLEMKQVAGIKQDMVILDIETPDGIAQWLGDIKDAIGKPVKRDLIEGGDVFGYIAREGKKPFPEGMIVIKGHKPEIANRCQGIIVPEGIGLIGQVFK